MDKASLGSQLVANTGVNCSKDHQTRADRLHLQPLLWEGYVCHDAQCCVMERTPVWELEVQSWSKYCLCHLNILLGKASFLSSESFISHTWNMTAALPGSQETEGVNKQVFYGRTLTCYVNVKGHLCGVEWNSG